MSLSQIQQKIDEIRKNITRLNFDLKPHILRLVITLKYLRK